jgi:hypothetical protein
MICCQSMIQFKMILPLDIQRYIMSFVDATRTDWRTCRKHEADIMVRLITAQMNTSWTFYDKLCYGSACAHLTVTEQGIMLMTGFQ